ncbi:MAG: beta-ketoacyl synthase chain length factor [Burkholderiales bacterium]
MNPVWMASAGVLGPGLPDWKAAREVLRGAAKYADQADPEPAPALLPPNERRRCSATARWALTVGGEALDASGIAPEDTAIVFTSCGGDGMITHQICEALAAQPPQMSPTRFHNSVHNAPAGYWSIFAHSRAPSTALCGYDFSFSVGLLEAAAQVIVEQRPVLLVAYDLPYPEPMRALWSVARPFAAALLLVPRAAGSLARQLRVNLAVGAIETEWPENLPPELASNPAAQALRVLALAARDTGGGVRLPYFGASHLAIEVDQ